ncbi:MAG: DUF4105 domain-containing protein [Candidatus Paceibacterota bacterium]|jgi:hypothetical protein
MKLFWKIGLVVVVVLVGIFLMIRPSNHRDWSVDNSVLAYADITDNTAVIHNIRNFTYKDILDFTPAYYDKTVDLSTVRSVDFIYEPFSSLAAHTLLSFGFEDGTHLAVSVEVRREKGEFFSVWKGIAKQFEIMYVIADERDVVKLRTNFRKDDVYRYPLVLSQVEMQDLLKDMLGRANALREKPEFYQTVWNNCTSNLFDHVTNVTGRNVWGLGSFAPKVSDKTLYNRRFMDSSKSFETLKQEGLITLRAQECGECVDFSKRVRE